jgi:hypothetical protein
MEYNKYKKAKYSLYLRSDLYYSFVTTCRSEEECINILIDMATSTVRLDKKRFVITKKTDEESKVLFTGYAGSK